MQHASSSRRGEVEERGEAPDVAPDDRLAAVALEYATRSMRFIATRSAAFRAGPTECRSPSEIVLWFHSRIYFTTTRALVGKALASSGNQDRHKEAHICARQTLVAVDRSRAALATFADDDDRRTLEALLDAIALGIEKRFPQARAFPRVGNKEKRRRQVTGPAWAAPRRSAPPE
jgi:hypothetical protein